MRLNKFIILSLILLATLATAAQNTSEPTGLTGNETETDTTVRQVKKNIITRVIDYFNDSNREHKNKAFDFSVIGGPHYSSDTKLGLGLVAAGLYSTNRADSLTPISNVTLYGDVSTSGFYMVGIKGNNIFSRDRYRLNYKVYFSSMPSKFWGIGYDNDVNDENETSYKRLQSEFIVDFLYRVADNLYVGPAMQLNYIKGTTKEGISHELWNGEDMRTFNYGVGVTLSYDTRDHLTNPFKGVYIGIEQRFYPRWLGNSYSFNSTQFTANYYKSVWKGGVIASQLHAMFTYGNTPWGMLATFGGSDTMRGYYEGRYIDKNEIDMTVELRQHVWRRSGVVAWIGAGTIFPEFSALKFRNVLPNYGIGYRWEFKNRVNVRLDLGFGKNQTGFVFNINEAF